MKVLTDNERLFIAQRLLSRVRLKRKNLERAVMTDAHPELIKQLAAEVRECSRLAGVLSEGLYQDNGVTP